MPIGLFSCVTSYIARIDELSHWSDRKHIMRQAFLQFCVANKKHFPADCFGHDQHLGTYPLDISVVAAFLSFLRYKGGALTSVDVKKVSTIHNQWLEVKQGILAAIAPGTNKPEWLLCSPKQSIQGKLYLGRY